MVISFFDYPYKITTGFFLENTIVVAEGEMLAEGIFQVLAFTHKPSLSMMKFTIVASCLTSNFCQTKFFSYNFYDFYV